MFFSQISLGVALSMDAVAVSICESASMSSLKRRNLVGMACIFGVMQGGMTLLGGIVGNQFKHFIDGYGYFIAVGILLFLGASMIKSSVQASQQEACVYKTISWRSIILLGFATSIDALAAGISIVFLGMSLVQTSIIVGLITTVLCYFGALFGYLFGTMFKNKATFIGGLVLILIAIKIFLQHN